MLNEPGRYTHSCVYFAAERQGGPRHAMARNKQECLLLLNIGKRLLSLTIVIMLVAIPLAACGLKAPPQPPHKTAK